MVLNPRQLAKQFSDVVAAEHIGIALLKGWAVPIGIRKKALTRVLPPGQIAASVGAQASTGHIHRFQPGHQAAGERVKTIEVEGQLHRTMALTLFGEGLLQAQAGARAWVIPTAAPIQDR